MMQQRRYPQRRSGGGGANSNYLADVAKDGVAHVSGGACSISIPDWIEVKVAGTEATSAARPDGSSSPERLRDLRGREEEAEKLRRHAHLHCRSAMDRAFRRAFADSHASLTADLRSSCCHEGRRYKRKRGGSLSSSVAVESSRSTGTATPPPPPHPSILPLAIVRVAPSLLDRSHLVRHLSADGPGQAVFGPRVRVCPLRVGRWSGGGAAGVRHGGSISLADVMKRIALRCILPSSPSTPSPHAEEEEGGELRTTDVIDDEDVDVDASLLDFMERRWGTSGNRGGGSSVSVRESMEAMLHWAANTNRYDGLVVFLEDREVVPPAVLDGLIWCLRTLRADRGLPVSIVVLVPSSRGGGSGGGSLLSGQSSSSDGVMVREFVAPDPADVVDHFLDRLVDADHEADIFTAIVSPELLEKSRLSFRRDHRSAVTFLCHLKMALANFFSQSGSFVVALHSPSFRRRHGMAARRGLASLRRNAPLVRRVTAGRGGDGSSGRPVLMRDVERWLRMSLTRRRRVADGYAILSVAARVLTSSPGHPSSPSSGEDLDGSTRPTQLLLAVLRSHDEGSVVLREMCDTMKVSPPLTILKLLKEWKVELKKRQKLRMSEKAEADGDDHDFSNIYPDQSEHDALTTFLQGIDELVVLYGEFLKMREDEEYAGTREEQSLKSDLSSDLVCWFQGQMRRWLKQSPGVDECVERFVQFLRIRFPETSVHAESRRTVAVALGGQLMDGEENSTDSCAAFVAMQGDRVISCSQWYNRFCAGLKATKFVAKSEVGEDTMWLRFAFAVYELEACGLVARKCSCRKEEVFEKRAMVWASGKVD